MQKLNKRKTISQKPSGFLNLMALLRGVILSARQKALRSVDVIQVQTYWAIGKHVVEFEQRGAQRAGYGTKLLERLAEKLSAEFGKGFDARNLRNMRALYSEFLKWNAVRTELTIGYYSAWKTFRLVVGI